MIKTLNGNNGAFVNLGFIETQPITNTVAATAQQGSKFVGSPDSQGVLPPHQVTQPTIIASVEDENGNFSREQNHSLSSLANNVVNNTSFKLPFAQGLGINHILPSYGSKTSVAKNPTASKNTKSSAGAATAGKSSNGFQPYESLTGISFQRPEIVLATSFEPLFENDQPNAGQGQGTGYAGALYYMKNMNNAGVFFDAQMNASNLELENFLAMLTRLSSNYPNLEAEMSQRITNYKNNITKLNTASFFLWELSQFVEAAKESLELRSDVHTVDPVNVVQSLLQNFSQFKSQQVIDSLNSFIHTSMLNAFDVEDILVSFGYAKDAVKGTFSSTKLWLQLLTEMLGALESHSPQLLDMNTTVQANDKNPINITNANSNRFAYKNYSGVVTIGFIALAEPDIPNVQRLLKNLNDANSNMYSNVTFKNAEMTIAARANLICHEYNYSAGLSKALATPASSGNAWIKDTYGYQINTDQDNLSVWLSIVGRIPHSIIDAVATSSPSPQGISLCELAQEIVEIPTSTSGKVQGNPSNELALLTFESKYIDSSIGTLTPGGNYYFDNAMAVTNGDTFDVTRLNALKSRFTAAANAFAQTTIDFNLLQSQVVDNTDPGASNSNVGTVLSNAGSLASAILGQFLGTDGAPVQNFTKDPMCAILNMCRTNPTLKHAIFAWLMTKIIRPTVAVTNLTQLINPAANPEQGKFVNGINFIDVVTTISGSTTHPEPAPLLDSLLTIAFSQMTDEINANETSAAAKAKNYKTNTNSQNEYTADLYGFKDLFNGGSGVITVLLDFLNRFLVTFIQNKTGLETAPYITRYSGINDTLVMLSIFDLMIDIISQYSNQSIAGIATVNNVESLVVSTTSLNHKTSLNEITQRLVNERVKVTQAVCFIVNSLRNVSAVVTSMSNYMTDASNIASLKYILSLFDDSSYFQLLANRQQIMTLLYSVNALWSSIQNNVADTTPGDPDDVGQNTNSDLKVLDDVGVSSQLRDIMLSFFSLSQFSSQVASNNKILTVGIPIGFTSRLQQTVDLKNLGRSDFADVQNDIIVLSVNKVDLLNSDVIYKPQNFLFEMSRYVSKDPTTLKKINPQGPRPNLSNIVAAVPTVSLSFSPIDGLLPTYYPATGTEIDSFAAASYDFLSAANKQELQNNHVMSYFFEVYLRMAAGIATADEHFDLVVPKQLLEPQFVSTIMDSALNSVANSVKNKSTNVSNKGGHLFQTTTPANVGKVSTKKQTSSQNKRTLSTSAGTINIGKSGINLVTATDTSPTTRTIDQFKADKGADTNLSKLPSKNSAQAAHTIGTVSTAANTHTQLSDPDAVLKQLVYPKMFDRVFNVMVDQSNWEVDYDKTVKQPNGKRTLHQMILKGEILESKAPTTIRAGSTASTPKYVYRARNQNEGDYIIEKYFVTVSTWDETGDV